MIIVYLCFLNKLNQVFPEFKAHINKKIQHLSWWNLFVQDWKSCKWGICMVVKYRVTQNACRISQFYLYERIGQGFLRSLYLLLQIFNNSFVGNLPAWPCCSSCSRSTPLWRSNRTSPGQLQGKIPHYQYIRRYRG